MQCHADRARVTGSWVNILAASMETLEHWTFNTRKIGQVTDVIYIQTLSAD